MRTLAGKHKYLRAKTFAEHLPSTRCQIRAKNCAPRRNLRKIAILREKVKFAQKSRFSSGTALGIKRGKISHRDCSISLITTDHEYVKCNVPQCFKVSRSKVKVAAWHNIWAAKNTVNQKQIGWLSSNFVKIIQAERSTCHMFKVISANIEIVITALRIACLCSNLVQRLTTAQLARYKCSRSKVSNSRPVWAARRCRNLQTASWNAQNFPQKTVSSVSVCL